MTPSFLPLQLLSIFISFYLLSILYHSTLFERVEQAKTSEKNKVLFCFSSCSEYYFTKNKNNNQAEEVYLYSWVYNYYEALIQKLKERWPRAMIYNR